MKKQILAGVFLWEVVISYQYKTVGRVQKTLFITSRIEDVREAADKTAAFLKKSKLYDLPNIVEMKCRGTIDA